MPGPSDVNAGENSLCTSKFGIVVLRAIFRFPPAVSCFVVLFVVVVGLGIGVDVDIESVESEVLAESTRSHDVKSIPKAMNNM